MSFSILIVVVVVLLLSYISSTRSFATFSPPRRSCRSGNVVVVVDEDRRRCTTTRTTTVTCYSSSSSSSRSNNRDLTIALTREEGKNEKLRRQLETLLQDSEHNQHGNVVPIVDLPCIAHADGDDLDQLQSVLQEEAWDYVVVTSPEAARVLAPAWRNAASSKNPHKHHPTPSIAVVGKATQTTLESLGIPVDFCPSRALAKTLVEELPPKKGNDGVSSHITKVLYPASAQAATTLQDGLTKRGFAVTRLNTYDTVTAVWNEQEKRLASTVQICCFGSPSAVQGWLHNTNHNTNVAAACIGETSAVACRENGWPEDRIFYPTKPGIEEWAKQAEVALCHAILLSQM